MKRGNLLANLLFSSLYDLQGLPKKKNKPVNVLNLQLTVMSILMCNKT